jgi:hypothetical protein
MKERSEEFWESATVLVRLVGAVAFLAVLIYMVADTCAYRAEAQDEPGCFDFYEEGVVDPSGQGVLYEGEPTHHCLSVNPPHEWVDCQMKRPTVEWPGLWTCVKGSGPPPWITTGFEPCYELGLASDGTVRWREK